MGERPAPATSCAEAGAQVSQTHEARDVHQERLKTLSPPANLDTAVQLPRRDRPDLFTPDAWGLNQPPGQHAAATNGVQGPAAIVAQTPSTSACPTPVAAPVAVEDAPTSESSDFLFGLSSSAPQSYL
ncbi:hypothetical protein IscW_ISCW021847 [Ixodes scapularis]|uniref:Uncharacterized protein n=1 Tax=Ixodes scapularis TaxID=6945 RepID=B7Q3U8_IXOSC|nr:hypothetical protein IscW_ISCW021847 [Ixodes scapularis]|eukprot:XP_002411394.1 hypothetical protein IscW_ISCW021847 [Ixodes scapularis]